MSQERNKPSKPAGRTIDIHPTEKQYLGWLAVNNDLVDDVIFGGSAGGGKTWFGSEYVVVTAIQYPGSKQFIGRNELKRLMQSSFVTLTQKVLPAHGLKAGRDWTFNGQYNVLKFKNGSTIDMLDLAKTPSDPLFERFGSLEYTRGWIEEASEVDFRAYDVLKSRVGRHLNREFNIKSKLLLTLNPSQDWPYRMFYAPWKANDRVSDPNKPLVSQRVVLEGQVVERTFVFIQSLYGDNPFTAEEYGKNLATISDAVMRARLRAGDWEFTDANDTLFDAASIADLMSNKVAFDEQMYMTVDVARYGGDKIVRTIWRGWDAIKISWKVKVPLTETVDDVRTDIQKYGIPREHVLYDDDGIGGGLGDFVPGIIGFHGGAAPFGRVGQNEVRENYENLRTQCAYYLSQQAKARNVVISDQDIAIREEAAQDLQQIKRRDSDKDGKLKITKKEDIKSALGRSPDVGDTLMMRSYFDLREREPELAGGGSVVVHVPDYGDRGY